jgi:hypothetical protein
VQYSIGDLLFQWSSVGAPTGRHYLHAEFVNAAGAPVPIPTVPGQPPQEVMLVVDNNPPNVSLEDILHNGRSIPACAFEAIGPMDTMQVKVTAFDPEGHLAGYSVAARWGVNQSRTIVSDGYATTTDPLVDRANHRWLGPQSLVAIARDNGAPSDPPWRVTDPCAYEFQLLASKRVTNGYAPLPATRESTRHITLTRGP